jgi:hypothetical protein
MVFNSMVDMYTLDFRGIIEFLNSCVFLKPPEIEDGQKRPNKGAGPAQSYRGDKSFVS